MSASTQYQLSIYDTLKQTYLPNSTVTSYNALLFVSTDWRSMRGLLRPSMIVLR